MPYLKIDQSKITGDIAQSLMNACPFGAITHEDGELAIGAGCRMCRLCVQAEDGAITYVEEDVSVNVKDDWKGIAVFADYLGGEMHDVALELLGKAKELAGVTGHPVYVLLIGRNVEAASTRLNRYGADKVYVYDHPAFDHFSPDIYANAFEDFIKKVRPSSILVGATILGRSLAPKVAARFRTGLTADCTMLEMKENTDLVQIRPAFGGNIMAQIITPKSRPQFCTVRYKIFSKPEPESSPSGEIIPMELPENLLIGEIKILEAHKKPKEVDISEAEVILAVGRGIKSKSDIGMIQELADSLGARLACTRPLVENGWFDAKCQIGLSGRTVKPKLMIALGISGSVQFAAGMRGSEYIIAIDENPSASIFDIAHLGIVGDLYEIIPMLMQRIKGAAADG